MEESISNVKLYKETVSDSMDKIYIKYIMLMKEYITHFQENYKNENDEYYNFLFLRGLQTIATLFNMLFLYLKNLDITYKHCQQGLFYYVEFIGQIGNDNGGFLQLSSKDAVLFVYKKTLFDIDSEYKKNYELKGKHEGDLFYMIDKFSIYLNLFFEKLINESNLSKKSLNKRIDKIISLCNYIPSTINDLNKKKVLIIYTFISKLSTIDITFNNYIEIMEAFLKKVNKVKNLTDSDDVITRINILDSDGFSNNDYLKYLF
tara:strand:- start:692 stop:1474 length:783 start_codon:yes stop_codon:yes gene_type:complete